ncbi:unnamed protein product [Cochlearia groenlandica]
MVFLDIVRAQTGFEALRLGRSTIVGHLLCYWDSKNIKKQCEYMGITLLFIDEKVCRYSWVAILVAIDNQGMWNLRSQKQHNGILDKSFTLE